MHETFCGWNPKKLSERLKTGIRCSYCDDFALDNPDNIKDLDDHDCDEIYYTFVDNSDGGKLQYQYSSHSLGTKTCDELMRNHVRSCHSDKTATGYYRCTSPGCRHLFAEVKQMNQHKDGCHFKDHVQCMNCGYADPPWRVPFHKCRPLPTTFTIFDKSTTLESLLAFFDVKNEKDLAHHFQNKHVMTASKTLLKDPSESLMGGASSMRSEFQELMASALVLMCVPGRAIVHAIVESCYAAKASAEYADLVDEYGFLKNLNGLKFQVHKWRVATQKHNEKLMEIGQPIVPLEIFDSLLSSPLPIYRHHVECCT